MPSNPGCMVMHLQVHPDRMATYTTSGSDNSRSDASSYSGSDGSISTTDSEEYTSDSSSGSSIEPYRIEPSASNSSDSSSRVHFQGP